MTYIDENELQDMDNEIILKWEERKELLTQKFENSVLEDYSKYINIVKSIVKIMLFDLLKPIEGDYDFLNKSCFDYNNIKQIEDGDWQGNYRFFIFPNDGYDGKVLYTEVVYGSCSACDTLQGIMEESDYDDKPNYKQINDLMTLSLHIIQKMKLI